jgi:crotonobetainyl-CoA:carnitine CoA-transferase CaiB-like acyl-CoA transferase
MTVKDTAARKPLHGIRVVDFSMFIAGPYCTRYLADLGADVIKVEPPEGDNLRTNAPFRNGASSYFGHVNAGKRSVVLDLKQPDDQARAVALVREADILVENGRPGNMKRLGLDYPTVSATNPRLIYCSVSGYGQDGPAADRPAYAQTVQAGCGYDLTFSRYQDGDGRPPNTGIFTADMVAAVYAFGAVQTALYDRERTGAGQHIDLALLDCMMNLLPYEFQEAQFPAATRRHVYKPMRTEDGYVMMGLISPRNFNSLFDLIGRPDWKTHDTFGNAAGRTAHWDELMASIEAWTRVRTTAQCEQQVAAAGIPVTRYKSVREAMQDPQFAHRGSFSTVADRAGAYQIANLPFRLSNADTRPGPLVPEKGQHTAEILQPRFDPAKRT